MSYLPERARAGVCGHGLSEARARLLKTMRRMRYGSIRNLAVLGGEPVFRPPPTIVRTVKFGCRSNPPRPAGPLTALAESDKVQELFSELEQMGSGTVKLIEVKDGLPFLMDIEGESGTE